MATTVILGGGVGGVVTATELKKRVNGAHRVVLVDRTTRHLFAPSLLWLMLGLREGRQITGDLAALKRKGIEVIRVCNGPGGLDLREVLAILGERGVTSVLAETGPRLAASLLSGRHVDRLTLLAAPLVSSGGGIRAWLAASARSWEARLVEVERECLGQDTLVTGRVRWIS